MLWRTSRVISSSSVVSIAHILVPAPLPAMDWMLMPRMARARVT